jgi:hypothetical protein
MTLLLQGVYNENPMKIKFTLSLFLSLILLLFAPHLSVAQCVDGSNPNPVAYDTTIKFPTGVTSRQVKFPQFNPAEGMLRCVKLTVTMTGVVDTVNMQNMSESAQTATFDYTRTDSMTGPGLISSLSNSFQKQYGPYNLTAFDNYQTDTYAKAIPRDTVLRNVMTRTLTDSTEIAQFYGQDSITYNYNINVSTIANITGGNSSLMVRTSALVNFRFEYCACAKVTLPIGLKNFSVIKTSGKTAQISWEGNNDEYNYAYDVEVSRDGKQFRKVATVNRRYTDNPTYSVPFTMPENEFGKYFFRVRQHWTGGYVRYTAIKTIDIPNLAFAGVSLYPNPSAGNVGVKFVNTKPGNVTVQVTNSAGKQMLFKEFAVASTDYRDIGILPPGMYWVKLTDLSTKATVVKQLVVQ